MLFDPDSARQVLDAVVAAFAVFGGTMAYQTGFAAARMQAARESLEATAREINGAMADAFTYGSSLAVATVIIVLWSSWSA